MTFRRKSLLILTVLVLVRAALAAPARAQENPHETPSADASAALPLDFGVADYGITMLDRTDTPCPGSDGALGLHWPY